MLNYIILSGILLGIAFIGLAITVLLKKNGSFPETSVSKNPALRKKNIYCIKTEQRIIDKKLNYQGKADNCCSSC
jgi:hypothetical protein